jgi:chromosome segregation ATPase
VIANKETRCRRVALGLLLVASLAGEPRKLQAEPLAAAVAAQSEANKAAAATQQRIDALDEQTQGVAARYVQALADVDSLKKYNEQLARQVKSQDAEVASLEQQLGALQVTEREVQPLMQQMVETLSQFVTLDAPFLLEERTKRVANLQAMMERADVIIAEKYRRILEAYQIELEYGRTLDAYQGRLGEGDSARIVDFVRLGRVSLMYQTLDGAETGYWQQGTRQWQRDDSYAKAVKDALHVAKKIGAPDLLRVPVPAPQANEKS